MDEVPANIRQLVTRSFITSRIIPSLVAGGHLNGISATSPLSATPRRPLRDSATLCIATRPPPSRLTIPRRRTLCFLCHLLYPLTYHLRCEVEQLLQRVLRTCPEGWKHCAADLDAGDEDLARCWIGGAEDEVGAVVREQFLVGAGGGRDDFRGVVVDVCGGCAGDGYAVVGGRRGPGGVEDCV